MKTYRVAFIRNGIVSIKETPDSQPFEGRTYHYAPNGNLIYALIKAPNPTEAKRLAERVVRQLTTLSEISSLPHR